ncbi:MAG: glycosyltransferase [Chitinispirillaceae bacterium]|nr:glycosyltransferase [Chitinispirillaceae bacterium]
MSGTAKNVLLITSAPPVQTPFSTTEKRAPIGIGFLISVLRNAGHTVHFIDNYLSGTDLPDLAFLEKHRIDYVGIYVNTICFRHSLAVMHRLRYYRCAGKWNGKILVGGPHTTVAAGTIPDFVDYVVQGEGEKAILDIVEDRVTERIVQYERTTDLDTLPMPAWDVFTAMPYNWESSFFEGTPVFTMNTSRGCPFRCTFCSVCSIWGKQYTAFSAERVVDDIEYLMKTYNAKGIYFREDNFTLNKKRLERFCSLIRERNITIPWVCETRVNTLSRDLVAMMAQSGARGFYFGVESGSPRMLEFMEKDITVEQIRQAFAWCHEFGINTAASVVVGVPTEAPEDIDATRQLLAEIRPTVTWFNVFVGIPTSKLYRYAVDNNLYEFIDDRGLVYLKNHDRLTDQFYGRQWDAGVPVKFDTKRKIVNPLISVIMAVHNEERHLDAAIRSVLSQTEPNFEFIIIDDHSTDGSTAILEKCDDPRITVIHNDENIGLTVSLIKGLECAKGEYIARMDADDQSLPHRFETQLRFLKSHPDHAMVGSSYYRIDDGGKIVGIVPVLTDSTALREGLQQQNWFCHGSALIRRHVLEQVNGYNPLYRYAQDYDLWLRIAERYHMANIGEPLYSWRDRPDCISREKASEQNAFAEQARQEAKKRSAERVTVPGDAPLVSIIVPTYNRPHLIGTTLQSILGQSYPNIEIVVVNDCGTPVEDVVYSMNKSNRITYIRHAKNSGLAAARNTGIRAARGKYIGYLDDDDFYYPDHVQTLMEYIINNNVQVAYADAAMALQHRVNGIWETKERKLLYSYDFDYDLIFVRNLFPVLCVIHAKECIDAVGGFDETFKTHEDWDLWVRMSRRYKMQHIKKVTAEYCVKVGAGQQMTTDTSSDFNATRKQIYERYAEHIVNRPDIQRLQQKEIIESEPGTVGMYQQLNLFIGNVRDLIEKGDFAGGLALFEKQRSQFSDSIPELRRIDELMAKVKEKVAV